VVVLCEHNEYTVTQNLSSIQRGQKARHLLVRVLAIRRDEFCRRRFFFSFKPKFCSFNLRYQNRSQTFRSDKANKSKRL